MKHYWMSHFSGCGGSTLGAVAAGFEPILGIENNLDIVELYRQNIDSHIIWADIEDVRKSQLDCIPTEYERKLSGDILIIQSSPPCQDYSNANKNKDKQSARANILTCTFWQYELLRPEYIIIENVPVYTNSNPYTKFAEALLNMGYLKCEMVLDAANYGVPQIRKRFIAVFSKRDYPHVQLSQRKNFHHVGWYDAVSDLISSLEPTTLTDKQLNQHNLTGKQDSLIERVGYYYNKPKLKLSHQPCFTLRSHLADDGRHQSKGRSNIINIAFNDGRVFKTDTRVLSRLQGFPDSYQWSDRFNLNVHAIGNSVAPAVSQHICELIKFMC